MLGRSLLKKLDREVNKKIEEYGYSPYPHTPIQCRAECELFITRFDEIKEAFKNKELELREQFEKSNEEIKSILALFKDR